MIALYERVSTEEQSLHGFSLDAQKDRLEAYCKSQGWSEFEHFTDEGYTGTNMDRPALQRLLKHVKQGQVDAVVVYKLDRLGRRQKDVLFLLEDVFDKHEVSFKSATEPFDTSTPLGRAMLGILAVFGQLERDTIIERTKFGLRQRARQGLWPGAIFPFGYKMNEDGVLEIIPSEAELVREVFRRFIQGQSRMAIAKWLQKRVPNRSIDHTFVLKMITRRTYLGQIQMKSDIFEGQHDAIIDEETFTVAQNELQSRRGQKGPRGTHLLSKLLTCGECGSWVYYFTSKQKQRGGNVYHYARVQCKNKKHSPPGCKTHSFLAREIEECVLRQIRSVEIEALAIHTQKNGSNKSVLISDLKNGLSKIEDQENHLLDAVQLGALPIDRVKERMDQLDKERRARLEQLDDLHMYTDQNVGTSGFQESIHLVNDLWDDLDFAEQRDMLRLLIKTVRLYADKRIEIDWNM